MDVIDLPLNGREDRDGLRVFLGAVRQSAEEDEHDKLASITLLVRKVDPLAVLDSIYEADAAHFYLENRAADKAIAGAEAVDAFVAEGPDRFARLRAFAEERRQHTVAIGELSHPHAGPLFFTGVGFEEENSGEAAFPPAWCFVPQWQVTACGDGALAVANARIEPGQDTEPLVERIWAAHGRFIQLAYDAPPAAPVYHILKEEEVGPAGAFEKNVKVALERIADGCYEKIVLARAVDLTFDNPCSPLRILGRMRADYGNCHCFSLQSEEGTSFIGATPEQLVAVRDGRFTTEAIAGSAPRSEDPAADRRLGEELLGSDKDRREHRHVVESILRRLKQAGATAEAPQTPELLRLANVQHLRTPLSGPLPPGVHLLDFAAALHPTPAVGGTPRGAALPDVSALEPFPRGLFAGLVGCFDAHGNGEFAVGLRSALVRRNTARLYAGAGIVAGSEPAREQAETTLKMRALLDCIRGAAG
ncbi:MAG: isochorismate synthase [Verrucomicrobia bacterium]|jgi:menaquinone-specific isochorismate synthase|nr:isochorismate synthase [Verrucomicrobiota bacterium]